jgi:hypothetical protein
VVRHMHAVINDATQILTMLKAHSCHRLSRLTGFILVARTLGDDGTLRTHTLKMPDQSQETTDQLLTDCRRALTS